MSPWIEKYRPEKFEGIKGQDEAIKKIKEFIDNFYLGKLTKNPKKALILHGAPGIGKTSLAYALANEKNFEIFELNASDLRNRDKLQSILKPAIEQKSLVKKNKIILIDEVDGISTTERGGLPELIELIESTRYPLIITANDIWEKNLALIRKKSELVKLKEIDYKTIKEIMIDILRKENLFVDNNILTKIAINSKGDLRAAINDLQAASKIREIETITFDERNKEVDIFSALKEIFQGKPVNKTLETFDSVKMDLDQAILWVEENIPVEYKGEELAKAYEALSKVDVFRGRIYKQQYWRFMVYENILLSYGVSAAKKDIKTGFKIYKKPSRILKMWMNNQRIAKKKSIAQKYAQYVHVGEKRALREFPMIKTILKNPEVHKELKLTEDEIEYLKS
ncbi:MAG: replication factor C large subunit [Nanoarchaeota archaeon]|nr:replication factor C large subunit [Nanoarchaeota archaeon]